MKVVDVMQCHQVNHLLTYGDQLYDLPNGIDDISQMTVLRPGLHLGTFKKNRFEPALAWALASQPDETANVLIIDHDQWRQYVHGDTLSISGGKPGWQLLVCEGHVCGWGKLVGQTLKNFYPKGLRF